MGAPAAIRPGGPSAHRCRLPAPSIFRRSVRPLTTGLERAARRSSVGTSGTTRALRAKQARLGGPWASEPTEPRAGSIGRDRRCLSGPLRAAARGGGGEAAPAPAAACGAVGRGRSGAAGAGAGGPRASPGAAGGVGRGRCVHARWRSAEHRADGSVCGWGTQQPGGGAPFASVRARVAPRPAHGGALTAGRHAGRGGLLTSSRCRAGAASAVHEHAWDGVCTCGATRLRIEWSEERWDVVSSVRT